MMQDVGIFRNHDKLGKLKNWILYDYTIMEVTQNVLYRRYREFSTQEMYVHSHKHVLGY